MLYIDTSVLVSAFTREIATSRAQVAMRRGETEVLCISNWSVTEFSSAISIKVRTGQLNAPDSISARRIFDTMLANSLEVLSVSDHHFRKAATFSSDIGLSLRSGDALHLAIASSYNARILTFDKKLANAGLVLGVPTELL